MDAHLVAGSTLVAGLVVFLVGAAGWRMAYEQPMVAALRVIHADRRRRTWIHAWMIPAMFLTTAALARWCCCWTTRRLASGPRWRLRSTRPS